MAIVRIQRLPVPYEMYRAVQDKVGADTNPPEGLIVHTVGEVDGGLQIVDVWETEQAAEKFGRDRLRPAILEIAGEQAASDPPPGSVTSYELRNLVKP